MASSVTELPAPSGVRQAPQALIGYRPEIDGLRAIAVLAVVAFHASPRFVPGGFIGVDVFFVISGFLISGIICRALSRGTFSFADFYARRIRRIFPALGVTLAGVAVLGWFVLTGPEFRALQKHLAAGSLFGSNFALWGEAGYFDAPSEAKPLLHLWSLAIEEQFYLIWPPLLFLCWRRRLNVLLVMSVIVVVSFAVNVALVGISPSGAFYLPAGRMWELLLGGLLAYVEAFRKEPVDTAVKRLVFESPSRSDDRTIANLKAAVGLALIVLAIGALGKSLAYPGWWFYSRPLRGIAAIFRLDQGNLYPGWWALLPTIGTALVIWAGPDAWIARTILARRALVYIGLMSYPLYLWHWPLLSLVRITESGNPSRLVKFGAVAVAFVLATLTYELVEKPIRRRLSVRTPVRIAAVAASLLVIGAASLYAWNTGRWTSRTPSFVTDTAGMPRIPRQDAACLARFRTIAEYCQQSGAAGTVTTALLGDSHAEHFLAGVGAALARRGENVVHLGESGCPPLLDIVKVGPGGDNCGATQAAVLDRVTRDAAVRRVILSFRGAYYVSGTGYGSVEDEVHPSFQLKGSQLAPDASIRQALAATVDLLLNGGKDVWVILQVPELGFAVTECVGRPFSFQNRVRTPCAVPRGDVAARQSRYREIVNEVAAQRPALHVFDPMAWLCDEASCSAIHDHALLYGDSNHLNQDGSLFFADRFRFF